MRSDLEVSKLVQTFLPPFVESWEHPTSCVVCESGAEARRRLQVCAECGTTNTPTWRRSGRRLMCNACGLRRSRSMRSARQNANAAAAAGGGVPMPKREMM